MSSRFHNKWHRHNHHTNPTVGEPDSSHDPIASPDDPFQGDFVVNGTVSSHNVITTNLTASNIESDTILADDLTANNIYTTFLSAASSIVNVLDIFITETSGFTVTGTSTDAHVPESVIPGSNLFLLDGVGLSSTNWASFEGDLQVGGCVLTDCISSYTPTATAINVWNNLDLHGHSIGGIANDSLAFESGAKVQSDTDKIIIPNILFVSGNGFYNEVYEQYGYNNLIITPEDQFDWELINGDTEARVIRYKGPESSDVVIVIPHTYNGVPVTELSVGHTNDGAFYKKNIKSVYAPKSLKTVNNDLNEVPGSGNGGAFYQCTLEFASLPGVTFLGTAAFYNCTNLKSVSLPAATSIGYWAFYNCAALQSVSLPAATSIGIWVFENCDALQSVSLPAATSIGDWAFRNCAALQSVSLPAATSIGYWAFYNCAALQSVSLPAATSIGNYAFYYCTTLQSVSLPAATSIGNYAFRNCAALQSVLWGGNAPSVGSEIYKDIVTTVTNYVLEGTTGWGSTLGDQPVVVVPNFENLHTDDTFVNGDLTVTGLISTNGDTLLNNVTIDGIVNPIMSVFLTSTSGTFNMDPTMGGEIALIMTGDTTLSFTLSDYPDNKATTIGLAVSTNNFILTVDPNSIDISSFDTLIISNTSWNDMVFRKGYGQTKFISPS